MINRKLFGAVTLLATGLCFASVAADKPGGYLAPGEFDVTPVLEPAPRKGDPRYTTDRQIFRATRKLAGTPRWEMATRDAETAIPSMLRTFSCAMGVELTQANSPALIAVVRRAAIDTSNQTRTAKEAYRRERPFTIDKGKVCQDPKQLYDRSAGRMSYDYPSGHTTAGWTWALVLSAVAPDRAQQILERGRAYGDSRFICGAHNESAVEAGMHSASATMALVSTKPEYQTDLAAARAEFAALRTRSAPPARCEAEAALLKQRTMPSLGSGGVRR